MNKMNAANVPTGSLLVLTTGVVARVKSVEVNYGLTTQFATLTMVDGAGREIVSKMPHMTLVNVLSN